MVGISICLSIGLKVYGTVQSKGKAMKRAIVVVGVIVVSLVRIHTCNAMDKVQSARSEERPVVLGADFLTNELRRIIEEMADSNNYEQRQALKVRLISSLNEYIRSPMNRVTITTSDSVEDPPGPIILAGDSDEDFGNDPSLMGTLMSVGAHVVTGLGGAALGYAKAGQDAENRIAELNGKIEKLESRIKELVAAADEQLVSSTWKNSQRKREKPKLENEKMKLLEKKLAIFRDLAVASQLQAQENENLSEEIRTLQSKLSEEVIHRIQTEEEVIDLKKRLDGK